MIKNTNNLYRNLIEHLPVSLVNDKGLKLTHCPFMSCRIMVAVPGPNALSCVLYNDKCLLADHPSVAWPDGHAPRWVSILKEKPKIMFFPAAPPLDRY